MVKIFSRTLILIFLLLFIGCDVSVDQTILDFGHDETTKTFTLAVNGPVECSIYDWEDWVSASPSYSAATLGYNTNSISVTVNRSNLEAGNYETYLTVETSPYVYCPDILVKMSVLPPPSPDTAFVGGYVYDVETDETIQGAEVLLSSSYYTNSFITKNEGVYAFYDVPLDDYGYTISVSKNGYDNYSSGLDVYSDIETHDIYMVPGKTSIYGYVYETGTTTPISGVEVSIGTVSYTTSSNGYYVQNDIPIGIQTITASKQGYKTYSSTIDLPGARTNKDIDLVPEDSLTDTVKGYVYETGTSTLISGVEVSIGTICYTTSNSGYYVLNDIPIGIQAITASKHGYKTYSSTIVIGETTEYFIDLVVEEEEISNVEGYVYETGTTTPISGVEVAIGTVSYTTSSNGYYVLNDIPIGIQTITASKSDYEYYSATINLVDADSIEHNIYLS